MNTREIKNTIQDLEKILVAQQEVEATLLREQEVRMLKVRVESEKQKRQALAKKKKKFKDYSLSDDIVEYLLDKFSKAINSYEFQIVREKRNKRESYKEKCERYEERIITAKRIVEQLGGE